MIPTLETEQFKKKTKLKTETKDEQHAPAALLRGTTARWVGFAVRDEVQPVVRAGADPVVRAALPAVGSSGDVM